jgi:hypothetical protein
MFFWFTAGESYQVWLFFSIWNGGSEPVLTDGWRHVGTVSEDRLSVSYSTVQRVYSRLGFFIIGGVGLSP